MSTRFVQMLKHAITTCHPNNATSFKANFQELKILLDNIKVSDINLEPYLYSQASFQGLDKAPCTFVNIFENENVAINIFILKPKFTMPIHDHPMIHGYLKAMVGKLLVESYTADIHKDTILPGSDDYGSIIMVSKEPPVELTEESECARLSPEKSQFHRISTISDGQPAVLFDILTPPYNTDIPIYGPRNCSFYRQVVLFDDKQFQHLGLEQIPTPTYFYCKNKLIVSRRGKNFKILPVTGDTAYYQLPETILEELNRIKN